MQAMGNFMLRGHHDGDHIAKGPLLRLKRLGLLSMGPFVLIPLVLSPSAQRGWG
jgi:hypothetical protein